jgi:AraC-like DNA-binding protein
MGAVETGTHTGRSTPGAAVFDTLRSRDPQRALARLSGDYTRHRMQAASKGFDFVHMSARIPQGSFNILRYGAEVEIRPDPFVDFYMLEMPVAGGVDLVGEGPGAIRASSGKDVALLIPPNLRFTSVWRPGTVQVMLKLRAGELLSRWQARLGDPSAGLPEVPPVLDLTSPQGWRIREMLGLLRTEAMRAAEANLDLLSTTPLSGALLDTVVAYLKDVHSRRDAAATPLPAALRRVMQLIDQRLAGDLTVAEMAAAAGVSERSVFNLFASFLGTTPMAHVAECRLANARALLLRGGWSAAAAARASGIAHAGRFGQAYRRKFGEMPSETARNHVRGRATEPVHSLQDLSGE